MVVSSLSLTHFRNYEALSLSLPSTSTLLVGDNASGKTNMLEALYCLATTKSFRATLDYEMIQWGSAVATLATTVHTKAGEPDLTVAIVREQESLTRKELRVNGVVKRSVDYIGNLAVVPFIPADVELVTASPAARRHHIDLFLAQIDREYKRAITTYGQVIAQRNRLLEQIREGTAKSNELSYWNDSLVKEGSIISQRRNDLFQFIADQPKVLGAFDVVFRPRLIDDDELRRLESRDIAAGQTTAGPHRDDFFFLYEGRDLAHFGSRGEQRTAVLALKLAELAYMKERLGEPPLLLLDDIFSELDHSHREHVLSILPEQQTLLTTTDLHLVDPRYRKQLTILLVKDGQVKNG